MRYMVADVKLYSVINDEVLYHRGGRDIMRKVIVITSCLPRDMDFIMQKTLTAAAYKVKHVMLTSMLLVCGAMAMTWICDTITQSTFVMERFDLQKALLAALFNAPERPKEPELERPEEPELPKKRTVRSSKGHWEIKHGLPSYTFFHHAKLRKLKSFLVYDMYIPLTMFLKFNI